MGGEGGLPRDTINGHRNPTFGAAVHFAQILADHRSELFSCFRFLGVLRVFYCYLGLSLLRPVVPDDLEFSRAMGSRNCVARSSRSACWNAISLRTNLTSSSSAARMKCSRGVFALLFRSIMAPLYESSHDKATKQLALVWAMPLPKQKPDI
jgi:hypothetical protein